MVSFELSFLVLKMSSVAPSGGEPEISLNYSVLAPLRLSNESDEQLQRQTSGRVACLNHEALSLYLRTRPEPAVEQLTRQVHRGGAETRQVSAHNKLLDSVLAIGTRSAPSSQTQQQLTDAVARLEQTANAQSNQQLALAFIHGQF